MSLDVYLADADGNVVFSYNITHNLGRMAEEAGIYEQLWRPEEHGLCKAKQISASLTEGLMCLVGRPQHYKTFNPENGWGSYEGLVKFVVEYLIACREHPEATIQVSR